MSNYSLPSTDPLGTDLRLGANGDLVLSTSGSLDTVSNQDNASQAVRINLTTNPIAYLWGRDVGTALAQFVDEPLTDTLKNTIRNLVIQKASDDPRILSVQDVAIDDSQEPDVLLITVDAVVNGVGAVQIPIAVGGGL